MRARKSCRPRPTDGSTASRSRICSHASISTLWHRLRWFRSYTSLLWSMNNIMQVIYSCFYLSSYSCHIFGTRGRLLDSGISLMHILDSVHAEDYLPTCTQITVQILPIRNADKELTKAYRNAVRDPDFLNQIASNKVSWYFMPPHAPHFGSLWEAGVRSVKHLRRVLGSHTLTKSSPLFSVKSKRVSIQGRLDLLR